MLLLLHAPWYGILPAASLASGKTCRKCNAGWFCLDGAPLAHYILVWYAPVLAVFGTSFGNVYVYVMFNFSYVYCLWTWIWTLLKQNISVSCKCNIWQIFSASLCLEMNIFGKGDYHQLFSDAQMPGIRESSKDNWFGWFASHVTASAADAWVAFSWNF